jgi:superfamily II DNA or RNA helicase
VAIRLEANSFSCELRGRALPSLLFQKRTSQVPEILIINVIRVHRRYIDLQELYTRFTRDNPAYKKAQRLGRSTRGIPPTLDLFKIIRDFVEFPRGLINEVAEMCPGLKFRDQTITNPADLPASNIHLRDFQRYPVQMLLQRNQLILDSPTGSGKTVKMLQVIAQRGQKTLIKVHTNDLANQWHDRCVEFLGYEPGIINADHFEIKDITIAMVQSLKKYLTEDFTNQWGLVVLDECHHAPAYTFNHLIQQFPARFRYGCTATVQGRSDGLDFMIPAVFGGMVRVEQEQLFEQNQIMKPKIRVVETDFYNPSINDYQSLLAAVTHDEGRNNQIISDIAREAKDGHYCLVLSERIKHARALHQLFSRFYSGIPATCITSTHSKSHRAEALNGMAEGSLRVLFSTRIADEGLDLPILDRVFLTCPVRSASKVQQQIGRALRVHEGKDTPIIFDYRDSLCSLAESQYRTRLDTVYKDFEIEDIPLLFQGSKNVVD